jgi:hypothetical protein
VSKGGGLGLYYRGDREVMVVDCSELQVRLSVLIAFYPLVGLVEELIGRYRGRRRRSRRRMDRRKR